MAAREDGWAERVLVFSFVVLLVVAGSVVLAPMPARQALDAGPNPDSPPAAYAPAAVNPDRLASTGQVSIADSLSVDGGTEEKTVLIYEGDSDPEDIHQVVRTLTLAGHDVQFAGPNLEDALANVDAFVVIDPATEFGGRDANVTREFVANGGRLVMLGEPNRREISAGLLSVSVTVERSALRNLASEFDIVFGRRYLYDTTTNDGNFKHVLGRGGSFDGTVAFYTATTVTAREGQTVLETPPTTQLSINGSKGPYGVAIRDGNVLAVGDTTFLHEGRHNVGDNERFIGYVLEFALRGDLDVEGYREAINQSDSDDEFGLREP
jgi:hypothetical protein